MSFFRILLHFIHESTLRFLRSTSIENQSNAASEKGMTKFWRWSKGGGGPWKELCCKNERREARRRQGGPLIQSSTNVKSWERREGMEVLNKET